MSKSFPHLSGANEDIYGYGRETFEQITGHFDYTKWEQGATLTLLSVPWGVYDPVVMTDRPAFDTAKERDAWFTKHIANSTNTTESHVLDTPVRYQMKDYADLPFTFDYTSLYNYLIIDYPNAPVSGGAKGIKRWFFHITSIDYSAPSTTRVTLVPDWWVTVAPLLDISHMILARGHAPVAESSVSKYLSNPLANSEYLLAPDVDFGTNSIIASQKNDVINNGTMYAVICTKNIFVPSSGSSHYEALPAHNTSFFDGIPSDSQFAVLATDLRTFLNAWQNRSPQTLQALSTIYFVSEKLLNIGTSYTVFGVKCYDCNSKRYISKTTITQDSFGYADNIKHLAKLYTSPYAHIEVSDSEGNSTIINVEDLSTNTVSIETALNGAYPWLNISTHILNNGGASQSLTFRTTQANEFTAGGKWYETLKTWNVPCFSVYQSNEIANDYKTHWSRVQRKNDADTAYNNALASNATAQQNTNASASTGQSNANASASTGRTNVNNSANNAVSNNAILVAANTTTNATTVNANNSIARYQATKLSSDWDADFGVSSASLEAEQNAVALAATNNEAIVNATLGAQFAAGLVSAATFDISGTASSIVNIATTGVQSQAAQASYAMSQSNNASLYNATTSSSANKVSNATVYNNYATGVNNDTLTSNTATNNNASTSTTNNNVSLMRTNADNTYNTSVANAQRTYDTSVANSARTKSTSDSNAKRTYNNSITGITNSINEANVQAPLTFGTTQNGENVTTRPMVLSVNVVTESKAAIRQAATQFLRYGYALNQAFEFKSWNCMKNFTYWQVSDIWATGVDTVPEEGQDAVRRMLYDGVTCWRDPDKIGKVSIYDN